jgi:hypothetical protein
MIRPLHVNGWTVRPDGEGFAVCDQSTTRHEWTLGEAIEWAQNNPHASVTHPDPNSHVETARAWLRITDQGGIVTPRGWVHVINDLLARLDRAENNTMRGGRG